MLILECHFLINASSKHKHISVLELGIIFTQKHFHTFWSRQESSIMNVQCRETEMERQNKIYMPIHCHTLNFLISKVRLNSHICSTLYRIHTHFIYTSIQANEELTTVLFSELYPNFLDVCKCC